MSIWVRGHFELDQLAVTSSSSSVPAALVVVQLEVATGDEAAGSPMDAPDRGGFHRAMSIVHRHHRALSEEPERRERSFRGSAPEIEPNAPASAPSRV
jgi:hypothetical protein